MDPEDEARMIEHARHRDETEAYLLGDHTPAEQMLDKAEQRNSDFRLMLRIISAIAVDPRIAASWQAQCQILAERYRSL